MEDRIIINKDRPTTKIKLPTTGITVEVYGSLLLSDSDSLRVSELLKGDAGQLSTIFSKLIKSWNWYDDEKSEHPVPITAESVGWIDSQDIPVLIKGIQDFQKEQKKS